VDIPNLAQTHTDQEITGLEEGLKVHISSKEYLTVLIDKAKTSDSHYKYHKPSHVQEAHKAETIPATIATGIGVNSQPIRKGITHPDNEFRTSTQRVLSKPHVCA
jgi:hypothetical protein